MKKLLIALAVFMLLAVTSQAQFLNWGVRGGAGLGTHVDNISSSSPIMAMNAGVFVSYGFTQSQSLAADNFCLQTGLNVIRRGTHFEEVFEKGLNMSIREGYYSAFYVQLPILATVRYELPVRNPGHRVLFSAGPAVSYGLFGQYVDRKISPGMPQYTWNYKISEDAFSVLNHLDVNFLFGAGYEWKDLSFMLQFDLGLLPVSTDKDFLKASEMENYKQSLLPSQEVLDMLPADQAAALVQQAEKAVAEAFKDVNMIVPNGNNFAVMLTVGYQFPIR